jgi:hypothetical protein
MKYQSQIMPLLLAFGLLSAAIQVAYGEVARQESDSAASPTLLSRNPFLPADHRSTAAPARPAPTAVNAAERDLELRAFYEFSGIYYVSIFNRQSQQSTWLTPGDNKNGIQLRSFSRDNRSASVQFAGSSAQLRLKDPSETPLPVIRDSAAEPTAPQIPGQTTATPADVSGSENRPSVPRRRVIIPQAPAES